MCERFWALSYADIVRKAPLTDMAQSRALVCERGSNLAEVRVDPDAEVRSPSLSAHHISTPPLCGAAGTAVATGEAQPYSTDPMYATSGYSTL